MATKTPRGGGGTGIREALHRQGKTPGNTMDTTGAAGIKSPPGPPGRGWATAGVNGLHTHPTQQYGSQQKGRAEGAKPKDAIPPGVLFSPLLCSPPSGGLAKGRELLNPCSRVERSPPPASHGHRSRAERTGPIATRTSSRAYGPWEVAAPVQSSVSLVSYAGALGDQERGVWSSPGGRGSLGQLQSRRLTAPEGGTPGIKRG